MGCIIVWCIGIASTLPLIAYTQVVTNNGNTPMCRIMFPGSSSLASVDENAILESLDSYYGDDDYPEGKFSNQQYVQS